MAHSLRGDMCKHSTMSSYDLSMVIVFSTKYACRSNEGKCENYDHEHEGENSCRVLRAGNHCAKMYVTTS